MLEQNDIYDVNDVDEEGNSALMVITPNIDQIKLFISKGADLNIQNKWGDTLLMWSYENKEILALLIENGADINLQNEYGESVLFWALRDIEDEFMWNSETPSIVELLLNNGVNPNLQDKNGNTALMRIVSNSFESGSFMSEMLYNVSKLLIAPGCADINIKNNLSSTAFDLAENENNIWAMLAINPDCLNKLNKNGNTLLFEAVSLRKSKSDILYLHDKGADFYIKNTRGESAIDALNSAPKLPEQLQSLLEKIILEQDVTHVDSQGFGL